MQARRSSLYRKVEDTGDTGIIAHYTFEEGSGDVIDQSGNGNNMVKSGISYDNTIAKEGTFSLRSTAASHKAVAATDFFPPLGDFSFCMWCRLSSYSTAKPDYFASRPLGASGTVTGITIGAGGGGDSSGKIMGIFMDAGNGNVVIKRYNNFFTTLNLWYSLVVTVTRATNGVRFYRFGTDITSSFIDESRGTGNVIGEDLSGSPVALSNRPGATDRSAMAYYDDVRLYNRVLTAQEALDYHQQVLPA
jgi:hypothetical protein